MRRPILSGLGVLLMAGGLLLAPMSGAALAKGGGGGGGNSCARAQHKLAEDQKHLLHEQSKPNPNDDKVAKLQAKVIQDQAAVDAACGGTSGGTTTTAKETTTTLKKDSQACFDAQNKRT